MRTLREFGSSIRGTLLGTFKPRGRATRLDIFFWWAAAAAISIVTEAAVAIMPASPHGAIVRWVVEFIPCIPFLALFVRRMHDQGRSGWWVLMLPPLAAANFYDTLRVSFHAFDPLWPPLGFWKLLLFPCAIGYLILMLMPGISGANRYGPDPRHAGDPVAA
jgi:uncharacterized membrane protein YhaH (DUF805 family)